MAEPEFDVTGVRIGRLMRSLTRAGQVLVRDGRLVLLTSYGREIDSAPVETVHLIGVWSSARDRVLATVNGTRYALRLPMAGRERLLSTVGEARERAAKIAGDRRIVHS
ncbi:hypothetical protein [Streptomyces sparsus]